MLIKICKPSNPYVAFGDAQKVNVALTHLNVHPILCVISDLIITVVKENTLQVSPNVARPIEFRVPGVLRRVNNTVAEPAPKSLVKWIEKIVVGDE